MKIITTIGLILTLQSEIQANTFRSTSTMNVVSENDSLIKLTWTKFSKAILNKDLKTFRAMSTDCINCAWCVTNTAKEDTLFKVEKATNKKVWFDKLYSELCFISIDELIDEDYDLIFTKRTKSRMRKKFNLVFSDVTYYQRLIAKTCIIDNPEETKLDVKEVLLIDVESTPKHEGPRMAFAFIKINGQYKFCAFSSIP